MPGVSGRRISYDTVSTNALTFSWFGTLQGGSAVDTCTLTNNATFALKGGDGLDVSAVRSPTPTGSTAGKAAGGSLPCIGSATLTAAGTTGFNGTSANVTLGFTDITDLAGSGT